MRRGGSWLRGKEGGGRGVGTLLLQCCVVLSDVCCFAFKFGRKGISCVQVLFLSLNRYKKNMILFFL